MQNLQYNELINAFYLFDLKFCPNSCLLHHRIFVLIKVYLDKNNFLRLLKQQIIVQMDATKKPLRIPPDFGIYAEEHEVFDLYKVIGIIGV